MGTRSLTFVYSDGAPVVCMYRQFDGYPTGHGHDLAEFLSRFEAITNGIRVGDTRKIANGMGCLAAQMVGAFKTEAGNFYLYPTNTKDAGQEYEYRVYVDRVEVKETWADKRIFKGTWAEFTDFCKATAVAE